MKKVGTGTKTVAQWSKNRAARNIKKKLCGQGLKTAWPGNKTVWQGVSINEIC